MYVARDFTSADQQRVRRLILGGLSERWGSEFDESYNPDLDNITATYIDRGATVVVVEAEGELVATGVLLRLEERLGQLVRISVAADHRRHGLGRLVVDELIKRGRGRGMKELRVVADTPWHSAIALYRSCGFEMTSQDEIDTVFRMTLGS